MIMHNFSLCTSNSSGSAGVDAYLDLRLPDNGRAREAAVDVRWHDRVVLCLGADRMLGRGKLATLSVPQ